MGCTLLVKNTILSFKVIYISLTKKKQHKLLQSLKIPLLFIIYLPRIFEKILSLTSGFWCKYKELQ